MLVNQTEHCGQWVTMQTAKKLVRRFGFSQATSVGLILGQRNLTELLQQFLLRVGQEEDLILACREEVEEAATRYESRSPQPVESIFDWLYETLPDSLNEQRQALIDETWASAARNGDGNG